MYAPANTSVDILRGLTYDDAGDITDSQGQILIASGVPANLVEYKHTTNRPVDQLPRIVRGSTCFLPSGTDITKDDHLVDKRSGRTYEVRAVTVSPTESGLPGFIPDLELELERVTDTEHS